MPAGVSFNAATGVLAGTPSTLGTGTGGVYDLVFTAANGAGSYSQNFTLTVDEAPAFTDGPATTPTTAGNAYVFIYTTQADDYPAPTYALASGTLPSGLSLNPLTGVLSGTPAPSTATPMVGGSFTGVITASNGVGSAASQAFSIVVDQAPFFTSVATANFTQAVSGSFTVTAVGYPAAPAVNFSLTGGSLPTGLTFNPTTGVISGTPSGAARPYPVTLDAFNGTGITTQNFILYLNPGLSRRYDFNAGSNVGVTAPGFTGALASDTLAANGDQWTTPVLTFNTGSGGGSATPLLYEDFAWGTTTEQTLQLTATPGADLQHPPLRRRLADDQRLVQGAGARP